ncbi:MAG: hypothetical protein WA463_14730 [Terriglobales bacterium]
MRSIVKIAACLCLLLTVWSAAAVVAHHHASNSESLTCPVCVAARAPAAAIARAGGPKPVFLFLSTVRSEPVSAKYRLVVFALSVRPPPAA